MATYGQTALTLSDLRKRLAPDGSLDIIFEALENVNPIIDDARWIEGNLRTGNRTTLRASKPKPSVRYVNRGVQKSKSTTRQIEDTCIMLEDRSEVDIELIKLAAPNGEAFRYSEDKAFVQGFSDVVAENIFYGNSTEDLNTFNGLAARYAIVGGEKNDAGYQVVSAGTANSNDKNTSIYIVGWGDTGTTGIYPKGSKAGLDKRDLGELPVYDDEGNAYQALVTLFHWDCGLCVRDIRANARLANIDTTTLAGMTSANSLKFMQSLAMAKNRIRNLDNKQNNYVMYVSDSVYDFMENYQLDKTNVFVTVREMMNQPPTMYFRGIPVKRCEAIAETESKVESA